MNQRFLELQKRNFFAALQEKTGWGKNDVWNAFLVATADAAVECLDEEKHAELPDDIIPF